MNDTLNATEPASILPTNSDIYYKLGGLEAKLDAHLTAVFTAQTATSITLKDHEVRLGTLEASSDRRAGMFAWVIPVASIILAALTTLATRFVHV